MNNISTITWDLKYRLRNVDGQVVDSTVESTWKRVAKSLAEVEKKESQSFYEEVFYNAMSDFKFLPGGRIIAGAGTGREVTLFNCYVMGTIEDSMKGIFKSISEAAFTQQQGGGIGMNFSTLRPKGAVVRKLGSTSSGPISFMEVWDAMCKTIMSAGSRRGAMMGTMRCDHPDIEEFIEVKRDKTKLRNFNLSVLCTDDFMEAVSNSKDWPLLFDGKVYKTVNAKELWDKIIKTTYDVAEPGVIFIDRINQENNLSYCETIQCTNPCGEQPLPPYGACLLGSINLAAHVDLPFEDPILYIDELVSTVQAAVRMMDNVIDISNFPLPEQELEAKKKRRIGLGVTGLADTLAMFKTKYSSKEGIELAQSWMKIITNAAYSTSSQIASEKGSFELFDVVEYLKNPVINRLEDTTKNYIEVNGLRNSHLTSIAPTGTISLFANNVSSGIEPMFYCEYDRKMLQPDGSMKVEKVMDYAVSKWHDLYGDKELPDYFMTIEDLNPMDHLNMQAALQPYIDTSISKTINVPEDISFEDFGDVYMTAYHLGLKGCTTYRPNPITGSILSKSDDTSKKLEVINSLTPREPKLEGNTYKIKPGEHAIYITINDHIIDGKRQPFEVFFNSKNMEHFQWVVALSRMISAVFRRGGDTEFVVEELKAVFDPCGGHWTEGRYIPSVVAAIGSVLEKHMTEIGMINGKKPSLTHSLKGICPKCSERELIKAEGCDKCLSCGYSKCS